MTPCPSRKLLTALVCASAALTLSCGEEEEAPPPVADNNGGGECVSTPSYFNEQVWTPILSARCIACHNAQGAAKDSRLVLVDANQPGYLETNLATVENVAGLERDGVSILLIKPIGGDDHGGAVQIEENGEEYQALAGLVDRFKNPVECEESSDTSAFEGLVLMDEQETLRKAAVTLVGRLPSDEEIDRVREGGEPTLLAVLDEMMQEDAFYEWIMEVYNDKFLTNRYRGRNNAIDLLSDDDFPDRYWHDELDEGLPEEFRERANRYTNNSVAAEPLQLVAHVVRNDKPFTEVLTANYTMVNWYSARVYGVQDQINWSNPEDPNEWHTVELAGVPHAGVLTSPMWLNRFPTTDTNVNRHRSRMVHKFFLATDVLRLAERPVDPASVAGHNPTLNDPNCSVCHAVVDPVAGVFQNWTPSGRYSPPEEGWHAELRSPGFGDLQLPWEERYEALGWLAEQIAADRRFVTSAVQVVYEGLTGQKPLLTPTDRESPSYAVRLARSEAQDKVFKEIGDQMVAADYNLKAAIKGVILSPYFRAKNAEPGLDPAKVEEQAVIGAARFLTPEILHRKINAVLGYPYLEAYNSRPVLISGQDYLIFYGGIDSDSVTERITEPNGIMANVAQRMANHMGCVSVPRDFYNTEASERRLFRYVELSFEPEDANGFEVAQAVAAIKTNIQFLHEYILGERLALDDPEIERTFQLFLETWREGNIGMREAGYSDRLPGACQINRDWNTGEDLPNEERLQHDRNYVIRAWMAVVSYLLSDFRFLYE